VGAPGRLGPAVPPSLGRTPRGGGRRPPPGLRAGPGRGAWVAPPCAASVRNGLPQHGTQQPRGPGVRRRPRDPRRAGGRDDPRRDPVAPALDPAPRRVRPVRGQARSRGPTGRRRLLSVGGRRRPCRRGTGRSRQDAARRRHATRDRHARAGPTCDPAARALLCRRGNDGAAQEPRPPPRPLGPPGGRRAARRAPRPPSDRAARVGGRPLLPPARRHDDAAAAGPRPRGPPRSGARRARRRRPGAPVPEPRRGLRPPAARGAGAWGHACLRAASRIPRDAGRRGRLRRPARHVSMGRGRGMA
jgi:hypothetical protein